jgi:hypothetical protein
MKWSATAAAWFSIFFEKAFVSRALHHHPQSFSSGSRYRTSVVARPIRAQNPNVAHGKPCMRPE